jgi:hypothetical protein
MKTAEELLRFRLLRCDGSGGLSTSKKAGSRVVGRPVVVVEVLIVDSVVVVVVIEDCRIVVLVLK